MFLLCPTFIPCIYEDDCRGAKVTLLGPSPRSVLGLIPCIPAIASLSQEVIPAGKTDQSNQDVPGTQKGDKEQEEDHRNDEGEIW